MQLLTSPSRSPPPNLAAECPLEPATPAATLGCPFAQYLTYAAARNKANMDMNVERWGESMVHTFEEAWGKKDHAREQKTWGGLGQTKSLMAELPSVEQ